MIWEVDKEFGLRVCGENFSTSSLGITSQDSQKLFWGNILTSVVNLDASVDIATIGMIVNLAWEGVLRVVGDVVIHEDDDVVGAHASFNEDLVSVSDISLMAIVPVSIWAGNKDSGVFGGSGGDSGNHSTCESKLHINF